MEIIYLIAGKRFSGAHTYVKMLVKLCFENHIKATVFTESMELYADTKEYSDIYEVDLSDVMLASKKICLVVKSKKDYVIHSNSIDTLLVGAMVSAVKKCRAISTAHVVFEENNLLDIKNRFHFRKTLEDLVYNCEIIAVSEDAKRSYIKCGFKPQNITVIYNAVADNSQVISRKKKSGEFVVGYLGRLDKVKSIHTLIEAYGIVHQRNKNTRLVIVGDGTQAQKLRELSVSQNIPVDFLGSVSKDEVCEYMKDFDLYVLPSLREACPFVIIEAFNLRVPVIASNVEGTTEMLRDKENGVLFEVGNTRELAGKIEYAMRNPNVSQKYAECGYNDWKEKYSYENFAHKYLEYYSRLLGES